MNETELTGPDVFFYFCLGSILSFLVIWGGSLFRVACYAASKWSTPTVKVSHGTNTRTIESGDKANANPPTAVDSTDLVAAYEKDQKVEKALHQILKT